MSNPNFNELIDATVEQMCDKIPELLNKNKAEMVKAIKEKIKNHDREGAPTKSFKIDAKLTLYGETWGLNLSLSWSENIKKEHPNIMIDLHPELDIDDAE